MYYRVKQYKFLFIYFLLSNIFDFLMLSCIFFKFKKSGLKNRNLNKIMYKNLKLQTSIFSSAIF